MSNYAKLAAANSVSTKPKNWNRVGKQKGNPETLKPWKPGQSGNPSGRPKSKPITDMLRAIFEDPDTAKEIRENVKRTLTDRGMAGVILFSHAADRLEGKMPEEVTINDLRELSDEELEARAKKLDAANS